MENQAENFWACGRMCQTRLLKKTVLFLHAFIWVKFQSPIFSSLFPQIQQKKINENLLLTMMLLSMIDHLGEVNDLRGTVKENLL